MENTIEISEALFLYILKQQKFNFTLKEIDSIISPKLKNDILDKIFLDSENSEAKDRVENLNLYYLALKCF